MDTLCFLLGSDSMFGKERERHQSSKCCLEDRVDVSPYLTLHYIISLEDPDSLALLGSVFHLMPP